MTASAEERFWARVDRRGPSECWPWISSVNADGYGVFTISRRRGMSAHRFALYTTTGTLDPKLLARHKCRRRDCCNPDHLEWGTPAENTADQLRDRGRHSGARLTASDVALIRERRAGGETLDAIAADFGVTGVNVHLICARKTWRHVA